MPRIAWSCERGQDIAEYVGALALIAAIVAALVLAGIPAAVVNAI